MGRWIRRIVYGIGALLLAAVAAAAAFVLTFDPAAYKQEIAEAFESATGRKLTFARAEANLLTLQPAITLHDAALLNPPGFSRPALASAKRMHLILRVRPLLARHIAIVRLEIEGGDVLFEMNEKGERNWRSAADGARPSNARPADPAAAPAAMPMANLTVDRLQVKDTRVAYLHGPTGLESRLRLDDTAIAIPAIDRPMSVSAAGTYERSEIRASGTVGSPAALLARREEFPLTLSIAFGRSRFDVDVTADLRGRVPAVHGRITAKHVDLDEIDPPAVGRASSGRLFSSSPLPLGVLNAFDARGDIAVETLIWKRQAFSALTAQVELEGGDLSAPAFAFTLAGARIAGHLRINAAGAAPHVSVKATGSGLRMREIAKVLFEHATVSSSLAFTIGIEGRGRSMREIAASLSGPVVVAFGPGPISADLLDFLSKDIFSIHRRDQLALVCALARFDFARGIGRARRIVIDTTRATAYGSGTVNLGSETMDMTFSPTTKGKSLASVAALVPVRVHGPIVRPSAAPDLTRTPEEAAKSVLGVVDLPGEIASSIFGRPSQGARAAGCGGNPAASTGARQEGPGLLERGGDALKRLNPFQ